jgi:hypothetical protein
MGIGLFKGVAGINPPVLPQTVNPRLVEILKAA